MNEIIQSGAWLPLAFAGLMGLSMLIYALLDGYDLGVGILMRQAESRQQDRMIASIGPFWDANETWLVLGVGLLLVAFPLAHGVILGSLYLPVAVMLIGLILRGVAFDFRTKARVEHKEKWNFVFFAGSLTTALAQGYMLGSYILGFEKTWVAVGFSALVALCVAAGYVLIGSCWLILKTDGALQEKAVLWARKALIGTCTGIGIISLATPLVSPRIFAKWFSLPEMLFLAPVPLATGALIVALFYYLVKPSARAKMPEWTPFALTAGIFTLCFMGLAYSFYPYIVPDKITITSAASAPESLMIILVGALVVLPCLIGYTIFAYRVFGGKAGDDISYN